MSQMCSSRKYIISSFQHSALYRVSDSIFLFFHVYQGVFECFALHYKGQSRIIKMTCANWTVETYVIPALC